MADSRLAVTRGGLVASSEGRNGSRAPAGIGGAPASPGGLARTHRGNAIVALSTTRGRAPDPPRSSTRTRPVGTPSGWAGVPPRPALRAAAARTSGDDGVDSMDIDPPWPSAVGPPPTPPPPGSVARAPARFSAHSAGGGMLITQRPPTATSEARRASAGGNVNAARGLRPTPHRQMSTRSWSSTNGEGVQSTAVFARLTRGGGRRAVQLTLPRAELTASATEARNGGETRARVLVEEGRFSMTTRASMRTAGECPATSAPPVQPLANTVTVEERDLGLGPAALATVAAAPGGPLRGMDRPPESTLPPGGPCDGTDTPEANAAVTSTVAPSAHQPPELSGGELSPSVPSGETAPPREPTVCLSPGTQEATATSTRGDHMEIESTPQVTATPNSITTSSCSSGGGLPTAVPLHGTQEAGGSTVQHPPTTDQETRTPFAVARVTRNGSQNGSTEDYISTRTRSRTRRSAEQPACAPPP